jgi:hypothetical protein
MNSSLVLLNNTHWFILFFNFNLNVTKFTILFNNFISKIECHIRNLYWECTWELCGNIVMYIIEILTFQYNIFQLYPIIIVFFHLQIGMTMKTLICVLCFNCRWRSAKRLKIFREAIKSNDDETW